MSQVIIDIAGHQYRLEEGETIDVDYQKQWTEGKTVVLDKVLSLITDGEVTVGRPYLDAIKVEAKVVKHFKGPKTTEIHYKAKSRYRKRVGFRHNYTRLIITKIITKTAAKLKNSK